MPVPLAPLPDANKSTPPTQHRGQDIQPSADMVVSYTLPAPTVVSLVDDRSTPESPNGAETPPLSPPPVAAVAEAATVVGKGEPVGADTALKSVEEPAVEEPAVEEPAEEEPAEEDLQALEALMQLRDAPAHEFKVAPVVAPPAPPHPVVPPYGACVFFFFPLNVLPMSSVH